MSKLGLATRTEARRLIEAGRVRVGGRPATDPAMLVEPERAAIAVDGVRRDAPERVVLALHKPRGTVTTRSDPEGRRTVHDLLAGVKTHVVPVGRLDFATSGLLLFTNDTRFADWLTDPRSGVERTYLVTVRGRVAQADADRLVSGIGAGRDRLIAAAATVRKASHCETHLVVTLTEGRNREVRRMFEALGHDVTRLRRVQVGGLTLDGLAPGEWRVLDRATVETAFPGFTRRREAEAAKRGRTR